MSKLGQRVGGAYDSLKAASPVILLGFSIASAIAGAVTTYFAAPKATEAKKEHEQNLIVINEAHEKGECVNGDKYTEEDFKTDEVREVVQFITKEALIFMPTVLCLSASAGFGIASYMIMRKRLAGAVATASAIASAFMEYRRRVIADHGKEADYAYMHGCKSIVSKRTLVDPETGEEVEVKDVTYKMDTSCDESPLLSPWAIKLDNRNPDFARLNNDPILIQHWVDITRDSLQREFLYKGDFDQKLYFSDMIHRFGFRPETHKTIDWDIARSNGNMMCTKYTIRGDKSKKVYDYNGDYMISVGYDPAGEHEYDLCKLVHDRDGNYYLDFNCWGYILDKKPIPLTEIEKRNIFNDVHKLMPDCFDK